MVEEPLLGEPRSLGAQIREIRRERGLTQRQLGELAGIHHTYLSKIENDQVEPPAEETLRALARALRTDEDRLSLEAGKLPSDLLELLREHPRAMELLRRMRRRRYESADWEELLRLAERGRPERTPTVGTLLAASFSAPPNILGYCGPDEGATLFEYLEAQESDRGLANILERFEGAYPPLQLIAQTNNIADPFDPRVVEAYWIGNELLGRVDLGAFYQDLEERFARRFKKRSFERFVGKVPMGTRPHHSFFVLNTPVRAGMLQIPHTVETMDQCRVGWGEITAITREHFTVRYKPLTLGEGGLGLGDPQELELPRRVQDKVVVGEAQVGDTLAFHWKMPCGLLSPEQVRNLERYTLHSIALRNLTL